MSAETEAGELRDLSFRDYLGVVYRGIRSALKDNVTNLAAAVAYYGFLAIPAALLVAVGAFSVFAGPGAVNTIDAPKRIAPIKAALSQSGPAIKYTLLPNSITVFALPAR